MTIEPAIILGVKAMTTDPNVIQTVLSIIF